MGKAYWKNMLLQEVNSNETIDLFHEACFRIYENDPRWMPHLVKETEALFDRNINSAFQNGNSCRWVLLDDNFTPVGRIAAFYSKKDLGNETGGIGFYECRNNERYSTALFEKASQWLLSEGMKSAQGPVNFGERHQFWGCLKNENGIPVYQENYNPSYYNEQFIRYGFEVEYESQSFRIAPEENDMETLRAISQRSRYRYECFDLDNPDKHVADYLQISEAAFQLKTRTARLTKDSILNQLNVQKGVFRNRLIWFAYDGDKPVAVIGSILNWTAMVKHAMSFTGTENKNSVKAFLLAIHPDYQGANVLPGLLYHFFSSVRKDLDNAEILVCGIASYSGRVHSLLRKANHSLINTHITYSKKTIK